jgi:hypothetical protein
MNRHPLRTLGVLTCMLALVGAFATGLSMRNAVAHNGTPPNSAGSPLVGAWQWNSFPAAGEICCGPEPATFAIFHTDGTYVEWNPVAGTAIGIWRMTGAHTADLVFVFPDTDPSLKGYAPGTATFTIKIELDATGDALTATGTVVVRDAGGKQLATVQWHRPATRMTFETNPATGSIPATPAATPTT